MDIEIYTLVSNKYATLKELQQDYCVDDVLDMMEILQLEKDLQSASNKDQENAMKNNTKG